MAWRYWQGHLHPHRLVFIDETGADTKMTRRYGRTLRGERLVAKVPHGHWKTTTFVGGLRVTGMTAPLVVDGPINGAVFLAYVQQELVKTLRPGDTVNHGQLIQSQTERRAASHRSCGSAASLFTTVFPRL